MGLPYNFAIDVRIHFCLASKQKARIILIDAVTFALLCSRRSRNKKPRLTSPRASFAYNALIENYLTWILFGLFCPSSNEVNKTTDVNTLKQI